MRMWYYWTFLWINNYAFIRAAIDENVLIDYEYHYSGCVGGCQDPIAAKGAYIRMEFFPNTMMCALMKASSAIGVWVCQHVEKLADRTPLVRSAIAAINECFIFAVSCLMKTHIQLRHFFMVLFAYVKNHIQIFL